MIVDDDEGCPVYADTTGAAELLEQAGVVNANGLIRYWKSKGLLKEHMVVGRRPVYLVQDVWTAERAARLTTTRSGGRPRLTRQPAGF